MPSDIIKWFPGSTSEPEIQSRLSYVDVKTRESSPFGRQLMYATRTIQACHPNSFVLRQVVIPDGSLQGYRALVFKPEEPAVNLDRLPPEIQTMIYKELLEEVKPIKISIYGPDDSGHGRRPVRISFISRKQNEKYEESRRGQYRKVKLQFLKEPLDSPPQHLSPRLPPSNYSILGVSKAIRQEAQRVAYGANTFNFDDIPALALFLDLIGSNRKYLQRIRITRVALRSNATLHAVQLLQDATDLRSIFLPHHHLCNVLRDIRVPNSNILRADVVNNVINAGSVLLKRLIEAQKTEGRKIIAFDTLKVEDPDMCEFCSVVREMWIHSPSLEHIQKILSLPEKKCTGGYKKCARSCFSMWSHCSHLTSNIKEYLSETLVHHEKKPRGNRRTKK